MAYTPTTLLSLPVITTGTESGSWGNVTNNGLTQYLDIAIAGALSITATTTLSNTAGTDTVTNIGGTTAQYRTIIVPASGPSANIVITAPSSNRTYHVINRNATYTVQIRAGANSGVTLSAGQSATVAYDSVAADYVLVGAVLGTAQTFTAAQTFRAANAIRSEAASTQDAVVIAGRAGGTSSYAITLTPATLAASRTLTLPEPGSNETLGYLNVPQNEQTGSYTLVLSDAGKHIYRGSGSAATWTIPANSSVAYAIGTALTFINLSATSVSIAITTDTMYLSSAGTTGTRTLAQYGSATAIKIASTTWIISGSGLT